MATPLRLIHLPLRLSRVRISHLLHPNTTLNHRLHHLSRVRISRLLHHNTTLNHHPHHLSKVRISRLHPNTNQARHHLPLLHNHSHSKALTSIFQPPTR
jgi:hypothetical protein